MIIFGHVVAQEHLHDDPDGRAECTPLPGAASHRCGEEIYCEFRTPWVMMPDVTSNVVNRELRGCDDRRSIRSSNSTRVHARKPLLHWPAIRIRTTED
ncbi:hypothetical protein [Sinorhizobium meliloti]|uniref:hypothetical protein n=1 Tax=Rhizobium meliloti TaxID=382 RepID=UPI001F38CDF3|nr:hypothetical protein [Sinorhizobium meliloti]MDE4622179.1 hypothetical protein [Sinorhizobium meliloti]